MDKEYLGDSVYASHDGHSLILTTENDSGPGAVASNIIFLEPTVIRALRAYLVKFNGEQT